MIEKKCEFICPLLYYVLGGTIVTFDFICKLNKATGIQADKCPHMLALSVSECDLILLEAGGDLQQAEADLRRLAWSPGLLRRGRGRGFGESAWPWVDNLPNAVGGQNYER